MLTWFANNSTVDIGKLLTRTNGQTKIYHYNKSWFTEFHWSKPNRDYQNSIIHWWKGPVRWLAIFSNGRLFCRRSFNTLILLLLLVFVLAFCSTLLCLCQCWFSLFTGLPTLFGRCQKSTTRKTSFQLTESSICMTRFVIAFRQINVRHIKDVPFGIFPKPAVAILEQT